jgi:hypothetical protein
MSAEAAMSTPERLVDCNAAQLTRFGYAARGAEADWDEMWSLLQGDFATRARPHVPAYSELPPHPRQAARIYMRRRLVADRLFEDCRELYLCLHRAGVDGDLVEAYTLAREAYEEAVYHFGAARAMVEEILAAGEARRAAPVFQAI